MSSSLLESKTMFKLIVQSSLGCVTSRATPKGSFQMQGNTTNELLRGGRSLTDPGKVES